MRVFYDRDADVNLIKGKKVGIVGYGSQGHAHANNLKDSGATDVVVALRADSASIGKARQAGLEVKTAAETAAWADVLMVLTPDELQADLYVNDIRDNLQSGRRARLRPRPVDPLPPDRSRARISTSSWSRPRVRATPCAASISAAAGCRACSPFTRTPRAMPAEIGLSYASAIGGGRAGILGDHFREECETDLFGEQSVLCGGLTALITAGYETLVEAGYAPEMAYFECLHEVKLIVDLIYEGGIANMRYSISNTAEYGDLTRGPRLIVERVRAEMKRILEDIQSGRFAREWVLENQAGQTSFRPSGGRGAEHTRSRRSDAACAT